MKEKLLGLLRSPQKGFTLIELLVVLGILGILAAALLVSINPVEQIKKAQDTSLKNATTTFVSAAQQYYSTHNALPWSAVSDGGANCYTGGTTLSSVALSNLSNCVSALVADGELKQSFQNTNNLNQAVVTNPNPQTGNAQDVVACFMPLSQSQQRDANTKYTQSGAAGSSCKSQGGANNCYWCAQ